MSGSSRVRRRMAALVPAGACLLMAPPGWAATLDPLPVLEPATPPPAVEQTVDAVTKTVDAVTKTVEKTVEAVLDPVAEATRPVVDAVADPEDGGGQEAPAGVDGSSAAPDKPAGATRAPTAQRPSANTPPDGTRPRARRQAATPARAPAAATGDEPRPVAPGPQPRTPGQAVIDASTAFRFPLLLAAALLLFLAIQGRSDRRDPRLADAAETDDVLVFG